MRKIIESIRNLPYADKIMKERDQLSLALKLEQSKNTDLAAELDAVTTELKTLKAECCRFVPPGHFYSPIPSLSEVKKYEESIFSEIPRSIDGIELCEGDQVRLFEEFTKYYEEMPYGPIDAIFNEIEAFKSRYFQSTQELEREAIKQEAIKKYDKLIKENKTGPLRYLLENPELWLYRWDYLIFHDTPPKTKEGHRSRFRLFLMFTFGYK